MAFREATPVEKFEILSGRMQQAAQPAGFREATQEEVLEIIGEQAPQEPILPEQERLGLVTRIVQRALGTDVDDPLQLERMGTVALGAIGGSMVGARVPPSNLLVNPVTGSALGGLVGAISGAVAPEATLETMEFMGAIPGGAREETGLSNEELKRVVAGEALLEIATLGTATGIRAAGRAIGKGASGVGKAEQAFAREAAEAGIELAPFQLGDRGLGRGIINVLGRFPIIGSKARSVGESVENTFRMIQEGAPSRIAPVLASNEVGQRIWRDARNLSHDVGKRFNEKYDELFAFAKQMGVSYKMPNTREAAEGVLQTVQQRRPVELEQGKSLVVGADGLPFDVELKRRGKPSAAAKSASGFLTRNGFTQLGDQSLAQADELILKLDQHIAKSDKGIRKELLKLLSPVRGALKTDIAVSGTGETARQVGEQIARVDTEFSETMAFLFETATAKKFGSIQQGGLRPVVAPSERAMRIPSDKIADIVGDLNSSQTMSELARLIPLNTYREFTAAKLSDIFSKSLTTGISGATKLNAQALGDGLGLIGKGSDAINRKEAVSTMLMNAKSPLSMKEMGTIVEAAQRISRVPIPNWSTFIARRAALGGAGSVIRGMIPAAAFAGSAAGGAAGGVGLLGGLAFLIGSRGLVNAVSNPLNARAIKDVLSKETKAVVKRAAFLRITRAAIGGVVETGRMSAQVGEKVMEDAKEVAEVLFGEKGTGLLKDTSLLQQPLQQQQAQPEQGLSQ